MKTLFILVAGTLLYLLSADAQVAVVVNKSVGAATLSTAQISAMYVLDAKTWPSGEKVVVFDSKNSAARDKFFSAIGKTDSELKKTWMRVQLSGNGKAPETLGSDDEVIAKVSSTPGAIGYVSAGKAGGSVKVVATIP